MHPRSAERGTVAQSVCSFGTLMDGQRSALQAGGHVLLLCGLGVAGEQDAEKQRPDERTRTPSLLITSDSSCVAGVCTDLQTLRI